MKDKDYIKHLENDIIPPLERENERLKAMGRALADSVAVDILKQRVEELTVAIKRRDLTINSLHQAIKQRDSRIATLLDNSQKLTRLLKGWDGAVLDKKHQKIQEKHKKASRHVGEMIKGIRVMMCCANTLAKAAASDAPAFVRKTVANESIHLAKTYLDDLGFEVEVGKE